MVVHLAWEGYPTSSVVDPDRPHGREHALLARGAGGADRPASLACVRLVGRDRVRDPGEGAHPRVPSHAARTPLHGLSKLIAEKMLAVATRAHDRDAHGQRLWSGLHGWGARGGLVATALGRIAAGRPVEIWGDGVRGAMVHAADVAAAFAWYQECEGTDRVFQRRQAACQMSTPCGTCCASRRSAGASRRFVQATAGRHVRRPGRRAGHRPREERAASEPLCHAVPESHGAHLGTGLARSRPWF